MLCLFCLEEIHKVEGVWVHCKDGEAERGYCLCGMKHTKKDGCSQWMTYHLATPSFLEE